MKNEIPAPSPWVGPLSAYLDWMRAAKRAAGTIYQHDYALRRFAHTSRLDPWPITLEQLTRYMASLDDRNLGAAARRTPRQALRGFYAWGRLVGRWDDNPAAFLPSIKSPRGVARPAPEHSVKIGLRDGDERVRRMIRLAVGAGLRCREICQVRGDDVMENLVGYSLVVRGKGDHQRLVPIADALARELRALGGGYVFEGKINGHLSPARVSELISGALPPGVTAHMLRHRYGTRAYQLGGRDLRAVQQLLGHAFSTTTEVYVDVEDESVRRAALAAAG